METCRECGSSYLLTVEAGKLLKEVLMEQEIKLLKGLCLRAGIIDKNNNIVWDKLPEEEDM
jgi:hypothetical protein